MKKSLSLLLFAAMFFTPAADAAITDFMPATQVLGQPDFTTGTEFQFEDRLDLSSISSLNLPYVTTYDEARDYLFVGEWYGQRVLIYDMSVSDGDSTPDFVLGKVDFDDQPDDFSTFFDLSPRDNVRLGGVAGLWYDDSTDRLWVSDAYNQRVVSYDLTVPPSNGMAMENVLGQNNFTSGALTYPYKSLCGGLSGPSTWDACTLESAAQLTGYNGYLYVSQSFRGRVSVFNLGDGVVDGEPAQFVIGKPDFTTVHDSNTYTNEPFSSQNVVYPQGLAIDPVTESLFITDNDRILAFSISSGPSTYPTAVNLIGKSSFTAPVDPLATTSTASTFAIYQGQWGGAYDLSIKDGYLVVGDNNAPRVLFFDLVEATTVMQPSAQLVLGQQDMTSDEVLPACDGLSSGAVNACSFGYGVGVNIFDNGSKLAVVDINYDRIMIFDLDGSLPNGNGTVIPDPSDPDTEIIVEEQVDGSSDVIVTDPAEPVGVVINLPEDTTGDIVVDLDVFSNGRGGVQISGVVLPPGETKTITVSQTASFNTNAKICVIDELNATFTSKANQCGSGSPSAGCKLPIPPAGTSETFSVPGYDIPGNSGCSAASSAWPTHDVTLTTSADNKSVDISGLLHSLVEYGPDQDQDGFDDVDDKCAGTVLEGGPVPSRHLRPWGMGDDEVIDGCNASQILKCKPGRNRGEKKWGIHWGTQWMFANGLGWAANCSFDND